MLWRRAWILGWIIGLCLATAGAPGARAEVISIHGKVTAEDGGALEDARVRLFALTDRRDDALARLAGEAPLPVAEARPAVDGRFQIAAPEAGMWRLEAEARDRLPVTLELLALIEEMTVADVELPAREALEVRVVDADGEPAAGVWVRATPSGDVPRFGRRSVRGFRSGWRPVERLARTDADGRVALARGPDEKLTLRAGGPLHVESEELETRKASADLRLGAGTILTVRAVDRNRSPLTGVVALAGDGEWPAAADDAGLIELAVPAEGKLGLRLFDAEDRSYDGSIAAPPTAIADPLALELAEPRRLTGRVIDADSRRPVAGALVWPAAAPVQLTRADGRGGFSLAIGRTGNVWLLAARPGYQSGRLDVAERSPHEPVIALEPAARVRGVVVDASGRPLAAAEVGVRRDAPGGPRMIFTFGGMGEDARTRSDEEGRFLVTGVEPGDGYIAFARRDGFALGETPLPELEPLATVEGVRIVLDTGARLIGRVVDPSGAPVPGAKVVLQAAMGGGSMRMFRSLGRIEDGDAPEAWSDNQGDFELLHLEAGSFDLEVSAAGFATLTVPGVEVGAHAATADAGAIVLEPGVELSGRVVDADGRPVEGAELWALASNPANAMRMRFGGREGEPDATSAADGHFSMSDRLPGERLDLVARHGGYSAATLSGIEVPPLAPVEVVLRPASSLSGKVVDSGGEPVARARVQAFAEGGGATSGGAVFMMSIAGFAASDEEGEFTIEDVEPGTVRLSANARGFRETEISNIEVPSGEDVEGLEIELLEGASVRGRVRASDGRPVAGAQVRVVEQRRPMGMMGGFGVTTDGDGSYFLEGLEPGTRLIGASHDDEGEVTRELEVEKGENRLDLTFEGGVEVAGRVLDEAGAPLAGAVVYLSSSVRAFRGGSETRSSSDGSFTLSGIRDGSYQVTAFKEGFAQPREETEVEVAGAPVYGVEVRLGAASVISGQIRGLDPGQLVAVDIWASAGRGRYAPGEVRHDGTYRVPDVGPGTWTVGARTSDGSGQAEGRVTVEPGQPEAVLDLEFGGGLKVTGRVLQGADPVAGISLSIMGVDVRSNASGLTDRDGRFSIAGVQPGRHRVTVMDFSSGLQHSEEHEIRSDRDLVIELAVSRVSGRVVDATDSSPISGAVVRLEPLGEQDDFRRFLNRGGTTDAAGVFRIHNVSAGGYRLLAEKDAYSPGQLDVQVSADRWLEDLELRLQPTEGLALRVLLPSGRPAAEAWIGVVDDAGQPVVAGRYPVDQEGRLRLTTVPAGSWRLLVGASGTAVSSVLAVAPGNAGDVRLLPEARLEVRILELAEDRSIVTVEAIGGDGLPAVTFTWSGNVERRWRGSFGRVRVDGLAPGAWLIRATTPDGRVWNERVTLAAGDNPTLELD